MFGKGMFEEGIFGKIILFDKGIYDKRMFDNV